MKLRQIGSVIVFRISPIEGSGCGSVGRAVASDTRGPWLNPVIVKTYIEHLFTCLLSTVLKRRNKLRGPLLY